MGRCISSTNNKIAVTGYTGSLTELLLPVKIGIYPVTAINASAFKNCTTLKYISIPSYVLTIGKGAFDGCTDLKIYCREYSEAEAYASSNNLTWFSRGDVNGGPGKKHVGGALAKGL